MKARFQLYIRQHRTGWYTAQVVELPAYTAFGPHPGALEDELREALQQDLADDALRIRGEDDYAHPRLRPRRLELELRAVQHGRLVQVPLRFLIGVRELVGGRTLVLVPKLGERVEVQGEAEALLWTEEIIRGRLHLEPVSRLLELQYERSERFEQLELSFTEAARRGRRRPRREGPGEDELEGLAFGPLAAAGEPRVREARARRSAPPRGRDAEIDAALRVLAAAPVPAVLLVGPSGVGKTAVVQGVAHRLARSSPARFEGAELWHLPASRWGAGARFLGEWQARARAIVEAARDAGDLLDLGSLPALLADRGQEAGLSLAGFLESELSEGEVPVIAEISPEALPEAERAAPGLLGMFQRVHVEPLPPATIRGVLDAEARRLERELRVRVTAEAVDACLDVIARFREPRSLPGSGLSLLGQMARHRGGTPGREVRAEDALDAFCRESGFPRAVVDPALRLDPDEVRAFFEARILGQPEACQRLAQVVFLLKAGLTPPDKPIGSFLLTGPTGVGKTESALTLAEHLFGDRRRLTRLDMSEYAHPGAALRLVDGPRGEGALTQAVLARPFGIVLFDEIEKADGGVLDLLLQVLGEARLTDGRGRLVSFRQTVVLLTSNLGADAPPAIGFGGEGVDDGRFGRAVERALRPELLNRIDHVVPYRSLDFGVLQALARRLVQAALRREGLERRGLRVEPSEELIRAVAEAGFDPRHGARPMKRAVEELVVAPLARRLAGRSPGGVSLRLGWGAEGLEVHEQPPAD